MTSRAFPLVSILFAIVVLAVPVAAAEKRVAMVVGNSAYERTAPLPNTVGDARAIADALGRLGFTVFPAYDLPQAELLKVLGAFSTALDGADSAIFFYAGHGMQLGAENYILPIDIKVENELSIRYGAVSVTDVLRDLERKARVAVVVLDACRDNPFAAVLAASEPASRLLAPRAGLAPMSPSGNGTIIAYAAAPGQVASDGDDGHSPYAMALLAEMEEPGVEIGLMFRRVAGRVLEETGGTQRPEMVVRLASEYYLAGLVPAPVLVADTGAAPPLPTAPVNAVPAPLAAAVPPRGAVPAEPAADRAALWGYAPADLDTALDSPRAAWSPRAGKAVAETEPNSSFGAAQSVGINDAVTLAIAPDADNDWLRVSVETAGLLTVTAETTPAEVTLVAHLVDANGVEVAGWQSAQRPGGALAARFEVPRPGSYLVQLGSANNTGWSPTAFPVQLAFTPAVDLYEPDNNIGQARRVALDGSFPLSILPRGDTDWFRFATARPGALFVNLSGSPAMIEGAFHLLNADGIEIAGWTVAPRPGGDASAVLDLPRPGLYYLQVADSNSDASDPAPLTLTTRFAPSPDTLEPDDSMAQAAPIATTGSSTLAIFPRGDTDWLEVNIPQPGALSLDVADAPENLDLAMRIVDPSGTERLGWQSAPRPGGDVSATFDAGAPGRYFIQVADGNSDAGSVAPFTLTLGFTASLDAFEPNDTIGAARPLTPGGSVPFTILPRGDTDWFRVSVDAPGQLDLAVDDGPPNLDIALHVLGTDWTELAGWIPAYAKGGRTEGSVDLPAPGTYYLQLADANSNDRSIEPATLTTAFTPTLGSNEPNNSFGDATPVELEGETLLHILPRGDADWQVFHATGPGRLDVVVDQVPENLDVVFRVLDADQREVQSWVRPPRPGGVTEGSVAIPAAGWYWIEIHDGNDDARSVQPFRLARTWQGG